MPDEIERTIYKLELDGSAYVEGVDKAAEGTKKLSEAQAAANAKLTSLKTEQANYTKQLAEVTGVLKANEQETINLGKRYNEVKDRIIAINASLKTLKDNFKGNSTEAKVLQTELKNLNTESKTLQSQMKAITLNTKEFRVEQTALRTNLTATNTAVKATTKEIAALEAGTGNFTKGLTKAYSGLRTLANIIPGIGIGGLVALIAGPLVTAITEWVAGLDKASRALKQIEANQANVNEVMAEANKAAGKQINDLKLLYEAATNANLPIEERRKAVKALQQEFPEYFKNLSTEAILNGQAKDSYDQLTTSILATARATAAKTKLDQLEAQQLDQDFERQKVINATNQELQKAQATKGTGLGVTGGLGVTAPTQGLSAEQVKENVRRRRDARLVEIEENKKDLQAQEDFLVKFAGLSNITKTIEDDNNKKFKDKVEKQNKEIVNIYEQELQKLKADIAKAEEKGLTTEESITKSVEADFKIREDAFKKAFPKQLNADQLKSLQDYLGMLKKLVLDAQIKAFEDTKQAYLKKINDEITALQFEESAKRIAAIQDTFERERQQILLETEKATSDIENKRDQKIAEIINNKLLSPEVAAQKIQVIKDLYSRMLDDLQVIKNQKLQELSFQTFEALTEDAKRALDAENLGISQGSLDRIRQQAQLFQQGKISFKAYQESLTEIAKVEANERFEVEKAFLEAEIKLREEKLASDKTLTSQQTKQLQDEIRRLQQQLADAEKGNITTNTPKPGEPSPLDKFNEYANAIKSLTDSIISFWQQSNAAEQQALERSIALQQTRVDAATRIAERGNAEYLKAEQDRLDQLNVARENAARKQLGIDAALQASQILVGITGAISKIATPGIGAAETIAEIAIIIGALATGYGLVKSLQGNQPRLFKGTKYLDRDGQPAGRDTIPVMANEGEAVIPTDINKEYHPAVSAIYDRTIPAEELNRFVTTYHKIKPIPQVNHELIKEAASIHIEHDGKMSVLLQDNNKKLDEHIELQKMTLNAMKGLGVSATIDRNGVAIMVNEYLQKLERDKKI